MIDLDRKRHWYKTEKDTQKGYTGNFNDKYSKGSWMTVEEKGRWKTAEGKKQQSTTTTTIKTAAEETWKRQEQTKDGGTETEQ